MKTPEKMAEEYAKEHHMGGWEYEASIPAWLAGYQAAKTAETAVTFTPQSREVMRIVYTEDGFDIRIPDDVTMTEAAQEFIRIVMENNRFTAHKTAEVKEDLRDRMGAMSCSSFSNNWISVEKALPDLFQEVIVAAPFKYQNGQESCHIGMGHLLPDKHGASWDLNLENKWILRNLI